MRRIVVIGAGLAGLTAAAALARRGHAVTLLEAEGTIGGKARRVEAAGARVDIGPTLLVDLRPLRALFHPDDLEAGVPLVRLDPALLATFPGGARLTLHADPTRTLTALRAGFGARAASDWAGLLDLGEKALRLADHFYARGDVAGPHDRLRFLLGGGASLHDLLPFVRRPSLARLLATAIATPELRTLLAHFARFLGLDADRAPAVSVVIPHLVATAGVFYPAGGVSELAEAILRLATKHGAVLETERRGVGLDVAGGRVRAVVTDPGAPLPADACVAAVDAAWLPGHRPARASTLAARVAWWVVEGRPPLAIHHALHFGIDPGEEPLYVATPTVSDSGLAPGGATVVHALVHGPVGEPATAALGERLRARIAAAGQWPEGRVLAHGVTGGTTPCYGGAIGPGLLASFRPSQRVRGVANLFRAGASVFPGPGVANVVRSGLRAAALAAEALGSRG